MHLERVRDHRNAHFEALLRIYEESFPASERKSTEVLTRMIARPGYHFLCAVHHEAAVGFAIVVRLEGTDAALLEYMAIDEKHRGCGFGQQVFLQITSYAPFANLHLLMEVDSDRLPGTDHATAARRKAFYRGVGCRELKGLTYRMPQVSETEPPPMEVLLHCVPMPNSVAKATVRAWLQACYAQVYGVAETDIRIEQMVVGLSPYVNLI